MSVFLIQFNSKSANVLVSNSVFVFLIQFNNQVTPVQETRNVEKIRGKERRL